MAKDIHNTVKLAQQKDAGQSPTILSACAMAYADIYIDLAAEEANTAEKAGHKIAVEVKSFLSGSTISEFHTALGQFLNYRIALEASEESDRVLYLAVPRDV